MTGLITDIKTQKNWNGIGRVARARLLSSLLHKMILEGPKLAEAIIADTDKTANEAYAEVNEAIHMLEYCIGMAKQPTGQVLASEVAEKDVYVIRKPKGTVLAITPWNFPLAIMTWGAFPALIEGNAIIWKPSEFAPKTAMAFMKIAQDILPYGIFQVVYGDATTTQNLLNPGIDCVLFTGSVRVGKIIQKRCVDLGIVCSCEMGSKSAVIVHEDADLDLAVKACVASAFKTSGQRCVSAGRILVHEDIFKKFKKKFVAAVEKLEAGLDYGRMITKEHALRVYQYNLMVYEHEKTKVLFDGNQLEDNRALTYQDARWLHPFVYTCPHINEPFLHEEVFGPHVAIIPYKNIDDAITIFNDTDYGLAAGAITNDFRVMRKLREELKIGMLYINAGSIGSESHAPFGGVKFSGNGWKTAAGTFEVVTDRLTMTINHDDKITWAQGMK